MSLELEAAVSKLERKAKRNTFSDDCRRITRALRGIGAERAADTIEELVDRDEQARAEALDDVAFIRRVALSE